MTAPNEDILAQARANVAGRNNPAHWQDIASGLWDDYALIQAEIARLLKEPPASEGEEA